VDLRCFPRKHYGAFNAALPKIAVAVPPKRELVLPKGALQWEKHKQGELEVIPKRVLPCF